MRLVYDVILWISASCFLHGHDILIGRLTTRYIPLSHNPIEGPPHAIAPLQEDAIIEAASKYIPL